MNGVSNEKARFSYKLRIGKSDLPSSRHHHGTCPFRYFYVDPKNGNVLHHQKVGMMTFSSDYDPGQRLMTSNRLNSYVPMEIGHLWPVGLHLSNIISMDMLLSEGMVFLHGAAYEMDGKSVCIFSPGGTGKTSLMKKMLEKGAKYIAEDVLLTDGKHIYSIPPNNLNWIAMSRTFKPEITSMSEVDKMIFSVPFDISAKDPRATALSLLRIYSKRSTFESDGFVFSLLASRGVDFHSMEARLVGTLDKLASTADIKFTTTVRGA